MTQTRNKMLMKTIYGKKGFHFLFSLPESVRFRHILCLSGSFDYLLSKMVAIQHDTGRRMPGHMCCQITTYLSSLPFIIFRQRQNPNQTHRALHMQCIVGKDTALAPVLIPALVCQFLRRGGTKFATQMDFTARPTGIKTDPN